MNLHLLFMITTCIISDSLLGNLAKAEPLIGDNVTKVEQLDLKKEKISSAVSISFKSDQLHEEDTHICNGVLITNQLVLTAAHCFKGKLWGEIRVIIGSVDLRQGKKYYLEKNWIAYDRWAEIRNEPKAFSTNDIAIIKLSERVKCSVAVPVSLSTKQNYELIDKDVVLVGWGTTKESPRYASRYLNSVKVKVMSNIACESFARKLLKRVTVIYSQYFCTKGDPYALIGLGDSGGPVLRKNVVLGINKGVCPTNYTCDWSEDEILRHKINLHTGIDDYRKFINDVKKNTDSLIV